MVSITRSVGFSNEVDASVAAVIAEGICEDVLVEGVKMTLMGTEKEIHDTLLELQLSGVPASSMLE